MRNKQANISINYNTTLVRRCSKSLVLVLLWGIIRCMIPFWCWFAPGRVLPNLLPAFRPWRSSLICWLFTAPGPLLWTLLIEHNGCIWWSWLGWQRHWWRRPSSSFLLKGRYLLWWLYHCLPLANGWLCSNPTLQFLLKRLLLRRTWSKKGFLL